jgi:hypothetical protein
MKTKQLFTLGLLLALLPMFSFTTANKATSTVVVSQTGEYVYLTAQGDKPNSYYISNIIWIGGSKSSPENTENRKKARKQFENAIASDHDDTVKYFWFNEKSISSDSKETFEGKRINNIKEYEKDWKVKKITL